MSEATAVLEQLGKDLDFSEVSDLIDRGVSPKALFIAAGPPLLTQVTADNVTPIGLVQDFNLQQSRTIEDRDDGTYEVVPGSVRKTLTLSGVVYSGMSLLRSIYNNAVEDNNDTDYPNNLFDPFSDDNLSDSFYEGHTGIYIRVDDMHKLGSYDVPIPTGEGVYLENCLVRAHNISTSADNKIISEKTIVHIGRIVSTSSDFLKDWKLGDTNA